MKKDRDQNVQQRLEFVSSYAQWVKQVPNETWSTQQKNMINEVLRVTNSIKKEGIVIRRLE